MRKCRENHRQPSSFSFPNGFFRKKIKWKHFVLLFSRKSSLLGFGEMNCRRSSCRGKCVPKKMLWKGKSLRIRFPFISELLSACSNLLAAATKIERESSRWKFVLAKIIYVPFRQLHYGNNWINTVRKSLKQWFSCAFPPTKKLTLKWDSN